MKGKAQPGRDTWAGISLFGRLIFKLDAALKANDPPGSMSPPRIGMHHEASTIILTQGAGRNAKRTLHRFGQCRSLKSAPRLVGSLPISIGRGSPGNIGRDSL